jgi:hypothetical protein
MFSRTAAAIKKPTLITEQTTVTHLKERDGSLDIIPPSPSSSPRPQILRFLTTFGDQVLCLQFAFSKNTM